MPGGVQNLSGAVSSINARVQSEEKRLSNLDDVKTKAKNFVDNTVETDKQVASLVNQNHDKFVKKYSWVKPTATTQKKWWDTLAKKWNDFWGGVDDWFQKLMDGISAWIKYDFKQLCTNPGNYIKDSIDKLIGGDYSKSNMSVLAFIANLGASFFDFDLPLDIRDVWYDITHWRNDDDFVFWFIIDVVSILPVIGVLKNLKYVDDIGDVAKTVDNVSDIAKTIDTASDVSKTLDNTSDIAKTAEIAEDAAGLAKNSDTAKDVAEAGKDASKNIDNTADIADTADDIRKKARKIAENYNLDEERFVEHILDNHGPTSIKANKTKFNSGFDIKKGIKDTITDIASVIKPNTYGRAGYIFEKTFDEAIGVAPDGTLLYKLKVVMDEAGNIVTAYPIK